MLDSTGGHSNNVYGKGRCVSLIGITQFYAKENMLGALRNIHCSEQLCCTPQYANVANDLRCTSSYSQYQTAQRSSTPTSTAHFLRPCHTFYHHSTLATCQFNGLHAYQTSYPLSKPKEVPGAAPPTCMPLSRTPSTSTAVALRTQPTKCPSYPHLPPYRTNLSDLTHSTLSSYHPPPSHPPPTTFNIPTHPCAAFPPAPPCSALPHITQQGPSPHSLNYFNRGAVAPSPDKIHMVLPPHHFLIHVRWLLHPWCHHPTGLPILPPMWQSPGRCGPPRVPRLLPRSPRRGPRRRSRLRCCCVAARAWVVVSPMVVVVGLKRNGG